MSASRELPTDEQPLSRALRDLHQSEARFKAMLDASPVPSALDDEALHITYLNPAFVKTFGYTLEDIPHVAAWWPLAYPDPVYRQWAQNTWIDRLQEAKRTGQGFQSMEVKIRCKDGSDRFAIASASALSPGFEDFHLVQWCDITERMRSEQLLHEREQRFRDLVESTDGIVWEADAQTFDFISVSENAERMLGYPTQDWLIPGFWASHIHPDDREHAIAHCASCTGRLQDHDFEYRFIASDARVVWLRDIVRVVAVDAKPRWLRGLMVDISAQKQVEAALNTALLDKTALLKEVHHRVKNNLQVISSLLRLEAARDEPAHCHTKAVLSDMQGRIRSMALLHESLYRSDAFSSVDLGAYLRQLSQQAFRTLTEHNAAVRLELDLDSATVRLVLDQAMPCGLLVNELISNCIKHGFPGGRSGLVRVVLQAPKPGRCRVCVSDDGVGLPDDFIQKRETSLGLQLVSDLSRQLGGSLEVGPGPGSQFAVEFDCMSQEGL